jgi:hypothetical protein
MVGCTEEYSKQYKCLTKSSLVADHLATYSKTSESISYLFDVICGILTDSHIPKCTNKGADYPCDLPGVK